MYCILPAVWAFFFWALQQLLRSRNPCLSSATGSTGCNESTPCLRPLMLYLGPGTRWWHHVSQDLIEHFLTRNPHWKLFDDSVAINSRLIWGIDQRPGMSRTVGAASYRPKGNISCSTSPLSISLIIISASLAVVLNKSFQTCMPYSVRGSPYEIDANFWQLPREARSQQWFLTWEA